MTVLFDADTGRLRLDRDSFDALVSRRSGSRHHRVARGARSTRTDGGDRSDRSRGDADPGTTAGLDSLREAGVLQPGDRVHPVLDPGLAAVADPICRLVVHLRDGQGRDERGDAWVGGDLVALLLDLPDGLCEFGTVHPTFLPVMLARIVELGPRPRLSGEPVPATPELLDRLTDPDPAQRAAAARPLAHPSLAQVRRDWRAQASWHPAQGSAGVRALRILDTPDGLWLVEPHAERAVLFPTTPTAVWRELTRLLPTDIELA